MDSNTKPGDIRYKDLNGDKKIDANDRMVVSGAFPKFNYGFTINAAWKGIDLSMFFQGVQGKKVLLREWGMAPYRQGSVPATYWRGAWDGEGTSNTIPHIYWDNYGPNTAASTWWLTDGSYLRMKNIQVGYTFPQKWMDKIRFQQLRVYFSGDNLVTFTKMFDGIDPERTSNAARAAIYPQAKVISFGIKATL